jgi:hypothetical protein
MKAPPHRPLAPSGTVTRPLREHLVPQLLRAIPLAAEEPEEAR